MIELLGHGGCGAARDLARISRVLQGPVFLCLLYNGQVFGVQNFIELAKKLVFLLAPLNTVFGVRDTEALQVDFTKDALRFIAVWPLEDVGWPVGFISAAKDQSVAPEER